MDRFLKRLADEIQPYVAVSYEEAERRFGNGAMSERHWRIYSLFWQWAAPRVSGPASIAQTFFTTTHGGSAFIRRMNRFREALGVELYTDPYAGRERSE